MKFHRQPTGSNSCGQHCVAMLADVSVEEATAAVGTKGKTSTKQIVLALIKLFVSCGRARTIHRSKRWDDLPDSTLLLHITNGKARHWVVWHDKKFYDPACGVFRDPPKYLVAAGGVPTSYLPIYEKIA